jgi:uncharacterized membrane protein
MCSNVQIPGLLIRSPTSEFLLRCLKGMHYNCPLPNGGVARSDSVMQARQKPVVARVVIGPNASLSGAQALVVMASMCAVGLGIAIVFAIRGFWPILPFAGLELAALGAALWVTQRRNRYREVISVTDEQIRLDIGMVGEGASTVVEMPRAWAQVKISDGPHRNSPTRLTLEYCGQRVTIGACLTDEERSRLAVRLRELLRPAWRSAPAALSLGE